ncbi:hypothetical protein BDV25DRAFT_80739 [Aspergillus avenaceus]|uniref:Uncharacterized protein n=1 Tax=Aspergillus avenaceus TaxID=36643 RepID=A0A5N6U019_ASPAV|nr:hypothetical protein BDV25DRAFT_80739 [Aspergillus avenaceus]
MSTSTPAQPSTTNKLLTLPYELRQRIYVHLLTLLHPVYLFQDPGCPIETFIPENPPPTGCLYCTPTARSPPKQKHILYSRNCFTVLYPAMQDSLLLLSSFLGCIGPVNARSLGHLCIGFPGVEVSSGTEKTLKLRGETMQRLKVLAGSCAGLQRVEILIYGGKILSDLKSCSHTSLRRILAETGAVLRSIESLATILVRVYGGVLTAPVRDSLQELGWAVSLGK